MLAGDFNVTAHSTESSNFNDSHVVFVDMRDFIEVKIQLSVFYNAYNGPLFTRSKHHHHDGFLSTKLDRVLVNDNWPL